MMDQEIFYGFTHQRYASRLLVCTYYWYPFLIAWFLLHVSLISHSWLYVILESQRSADPMSCTKLSCNNEIASCLTWWANRISSNQPHLFSLFPHTRFSLLKCCLVFISHPIELGFEPSTSDTWVYVFIIRFIS